MNGWYIWYIGWAIVDTEISSMKKDLIPMEQLLYICAREIVLIKIKGENPWCQGEGRGPTRPFVLNHFPCQNI